MLKKYPSEVKLVYKHFPIRSHKFAFQAAVAALAAGCQGKFWEFHDELYRNYNRLNEQKINEIASQLKLNENAFKKQRKNPEIFEQIQRDYEEGMRLGIRVIPTVFINGKKMRNRSMKSLEAAITQELKKSKAAKDNPEGTK